MRVLPCYGPMDRRIGILAIFRTRGRRACVPRRPGAVGGRDVVCGRPGENSAILKFSFDLYQIESEQHWRHWASAPLLWTYGLTNWYFGDIPRKGPKSPCTPPARDGGSQSCRVWPARGKLRNIEVLIRSLSNWVNNAEGIGRVLRYYEPMDWRIGILAIFRARGRIARVPRRHGTVAARAAVCGRPGENSAILKFSFDLYQIESEQRWRHWTSAPLLWTYGLTNWYFGDIPRKGPQSPCTPPARDGGSQSCRVWPAWGKLGNIEVLIRFLPKWEWITLKALGECSLAENLWIDRLVF